MSNPKDRTDALAILVILQSFKGATVLVTTAAVKEIVEVEARKRGGR